MHRLELIAAGGVDAAEARSILGELPRELDLEAAGKLFSALRAWTWKALDQKRRDPELRQWHDVMKRAQVRAKTYDRIVAQLQVLLDLVHESLAVALRRPLADVLKRRHAKAVLALLREAPEGQLRKQDLMDGLQVKQANLSRLMNVLMGAGLVERLSDGREAHFRLSRAGQEHAAGLAAPPVLLLHGEDPFDRHECFRFEDQIRERARKLNQEMLAILGNKFSTKSGRTWLMSSHRGHFAEPRELGQSVKKVGAAYFGVEHNMYGGPAEVVNVRVVREEPVRFGGHAGPEHYGMIVGPKFAEASNG